MLVELDIEKMANGNLSTKVFIGDDVKSMRILRARRMVADLSTRINSAKGNYGIKWEFKTVEDALDSLKPILRKRLGK